MGGSILRAGGRAAKIGVLIVELAGIFVAVAAAGAALLYVRLQSGPVSLALFEASAEYAIRQSLPPGHSVDIKKSILSKAAVPGRYDLTLEKIIISNREGVAIADLSAIELAFFAQDTVRGEFGPRSIVVDDAAFTIERGLDHSIKLRSAPTDEKRNFFRLLTGGEYFQGSVEAAELRNAHIRFHDAASGRSWRADDAMAKIEQTEGGYRARLQGDFDVEGVKAGLELVADYAEQSGVINAALDVDNAPVGDLLGTLYGRRASILSAPVSGRLALRMSRLGGILASRIDAHVGAGALSIGGQSTQVSSIDLEATFDPAANSFKISKLGIEADALSGVLGGSIELDLQPGDETPLSLQFELTSEQLTLAADGFLEAPVMISDAHVSGGYDVAARRLSVRDFAATMLGAQLTGALSYAAAVGASPEIKGHVEVAGGLDPRRVVAGWPVTLGIAARAFVADRLPRAQIDNVVFDIDLPAGALVAGQPAPDQAWTLSFDVRDASAIYSPGMTPLTHASGSGRLTGNRFIIDSVKGRVGGVAISEGDIEFTALSPAGEPVYYRFTASGDAGEILSIIDEEPLALLKDTSVVPSKFLGKAKVRAEIMRPNRNEVPRELYTYSGHAAFDDLTLSEFFAGAELTGGKGAVEFNTDRLVVKADAILGDSPVRIEWINDFGESSRFHASGEVDSSTGDIFAIGTRQMVIGPIGFTADAIGDLSGIEKLTISADFTKAALLMFDPFGWRKRQDVPATGALEVAFRSDGVDVRRAELSGEAISIKGSGSFGRDGVVETVNLERFLLEGAANFSLTAGRSESGLLDITLTGPLLSAGPLIQSVVEGGGRNKSAQPSDWGAGVMLRGRIDEVRARGRAIYRDATLDFRHGRQRMEALEFSARSSEGKPLSLELKETGSENGPRQVIEARTDDIGSLLSGIFDISSVRGGEGYMEMRLGGEAEEGGLAGMIEARNLRVVGAPLLARIFAAGSLDGLADLLNGEGISLTKAFGRFGFANGVVTVDEARATGPSVGITGTGSIAAGEGGAVALNGAIAPAYQVNSLLGKAPIIGDIFVNREGEGVVALSYNVAGPSDMPVVTVNPLSALAPGFLRRMFEAEPTASPEIAAPTDDAPPRQE